MTGDTAIANPITTLQIMRAFRHMKEDRLRQQEVTARTLAEQEAALEDEFEAEFRSLPRILRPDYHPPYLRRSS